MYVAERIVGMREMRSASCQKWSTFHVCGFLGTEDKIKSLDVKTTRKGLLATVCLAGSGCSLAHGDNILSALRPPEY